MLCSRTSFGLPCCAEPRTPSDPHHFPLLPSSCSPAPGRRRKQALSWCLVPQPSTARHLWESLCPVGAEGFPPAQGYPVLGSRGKFSPPPSPSSLCDWLAQPLPQVGGGSSPPDHVWGTPGQGLPHTPMPGCKDRHLVQGTTPPCHLQE